MYRLAIWRSLRSCVVEDRINLADAAIEADDGGEMPAWQLLEAARRTSAPRWLDHSSNGFLLTSHDASPLMRASSAFIAIEVRRQNRVVDLLGEKLIGLGKLGSTRRAVRPSGPVLHLTGCGEK